ncbi:hypothetical protein [Haliscomenobacter hydrossis]|uniref:Uncharacterized protein n=1 Tax=Haliscomenobacter hydrossis (strain ATCC 27775 / DSM 1100 / LMG 10767 / O) TaxID=760192 RepID=F4KXI2_HALH1|nr:hypothetical protein [Haliscomenobacter hydrossis]AEE50353.1 hypothetical protein Halhy_2480 [Haliscomenobacter hydrossis DSM 1100]
MQAIRSIYKVENQRLVIELPASFQHTEVEVIILPVSAEDEAEVLPTPNQDEKAESLERLMSVGVWDEVDEKAVIESQNFINQWKVVEF